MCHTGILQCLGTLWNSAPRPVGVWGWRKDLGEGSNLLRVQWRGALVFPSALAHLPCTWLAKRLSVPLCHLSLYCNPGHTCHIPLWTHSVPLSRLKVCWPLIQNKPQNQESWGLQTLFFFFSEMLNIPDPQHSHVDFGKNWVLNDMKSSDMIQRQGVLLFENFLFYFSVMFWNLQMLIIIIEYFIFLFYGKSYALFLICL